MIFDIDIAMDMRIFLIRFFSYGDLHHRFKIAPRAGCAAADLAHVTWLALRQLDSHQGQGSVVEVKLQKILYFSFRFFC